ncbi:transcription initiation factor TFIID subunit 3 [Dendroctonus ponderosae]|uniref:transcription initiation factor TFIID subunit 3 n=1 Tax=Dendroctonus ponderosae TaxID=77166 RepID=UPI002035CE15|nr:transcription initiation factor TFIID subunit 3 [Dendroctonus ponderosae]KAH1028880.1 hypothetical protein HUJ05_002201 [Dendroctonus ponderosae]
MSAEFSRDHCKIAVVKILQTIGWHSINTTPLEVLTDIMSSYIRELARDTNNYANEFGQTEPNLDHLGLAFQQMGVNLGELEEYVTYVNFLPPPHPVPKFPVAKESNLNFLKPGSKEVVTRPVHINEHLPPMYPLLEEQSEQLADNQPVKDGNDGAPESDSHPFKKPADLSPEFRRVKREDEGGRPTREISSVMMTTSGFLSPAREGRLPEAKAPAPPPEPPRAPTPPPPGPPVPELVLVKKKPEKKKDKPLKEAKSGNEEKAPKKPGNTKDTPKRPKATPSMLPPPGFCRPSFPGLPPPAHFMSAQFPGDMKLPPLVAHGPKPQIVKPSALNKVLAAAKAKTEKLNTTITAIPVKAEPKYQIPMHQPVDKLLAEPDKQKVNILRKISNVKEKHEKSKQSQLVQQAQDIVSKINLSSDITIEPIHPRHNFVAKSEPYFDDGSPPGTPPTPRTPEILAHHSPSPSAKEKRKRKVKPERMPRPKKPKKQQQPPIPHHHFMDTDVMDMSIGRPKTPDTSLKMRKTAPFPTMPFPFPLTKFGGPGLIPSLNFPFAPTISDFTNTYFPPIMPPKPKPEPKVSPKPKEVKTEPAEAAPALRPPGLAPPPLAQPIKLEEAEGGNAPLEMAFKKSKEHKKDKKDKLKKKSKKEKVKDKSEKKKLKEAKKEKVKIKKEKKKKQQLPKQEPGEQPEAQPIPRILLKVDSPSPRPETPDDSLKKLNIKPIVKKEDVSPERQPRETSPGLAQISALVIGPPKPKNPQSEKSLVLPERAPVEAATPSTAVSPSRPPGRPRIHPVKPKPAPKPKKVEQPFLKRDAEGNEVWICPACGQQDDGRPMIGCDGCDAWYHWVCVGIQVPPDENENWYCKPCLAKKNEDLQDKKKKRKKKEKPH